MPRLDCPNLLFVSLYGWSQLSLLLFPVSSRVHHPGEFTALLRVRAGLTKDKRKDVDWNRS